MHFLALALVAISVGILMLVSGLDLYWQGTLAVAAGGVALAFGIRALLHGEPESDSSRPRAEPGRYERYSAATPADVEVPFAVVLPLHSATPEQFQAIGGALVRWKKDTPGVGQILGLEKMLEGQRPQTGVEYFSIPCWNDPRSWFVSVALIFVMKSSFHVETEESLKRAVAGLPVTVMDPECYSSISR